MAEGCFIGIDQGSSSTKAVVVNATGQMLFQTRKDLPPPVRDGVQVEHDPLDILQSVTEAVQESLRSLEGPAVPVLGIGLACQRSSCLAWHEASGEPRSPVISWRDTRGADLVEALAHQGPRITELSGLPPTPYYSASKLRWLRDALPPSEQEGIVFGTLSSFLVQRLTGSASAVIDHTNAARTQLMNIAALAWDEELLGMFGLSGIRLPAVTPTAHAFGPVSTPAGSAPLRACIGDQQAAMLGLGVLDKGDGGINFGTGGFLMANTGAELVPAHGLMASVHYSTDQERRYLLEGSVNAVGDALEWARSRLGLFTEYAEVDDLCWKAATDVVAFIALNGVGAPHWEHGLASSIHGLAPESTSADIVRALVEGFAFFMKDIEQAMRSAGAAPRAYTLAGGLSSMTYLAQIQADLLNTTLSLSRVQEASAMGAAFLAGMQQGAWTSGDIGKLVLRGDEVRGERNPGLERRYGRWKLLHRMERELGPA